MDEQKHNFADDSITRSRQTFVKLFVLYPVIRDSNTMDQWNFVRFDPVSASQRHCISVEPPHVDLSLERPTRGTSEVKCPRSLFGNTGQVDDLLNSRDVHCECLSTSLH